LEPQVLGDAEESSHGTKRIPGHIYENLQIPVPPMSEQRRIADMLDMADAVRRKRKDAIGLTDDLLRGTFLEMFGDPVTNPKGWKVRFVGDVVERVEAGWSINGEPRSHVDGEYGVLKISAVTSGYFRPDEHKAVSRSVVDRDLITPRRGDLLFSRANTRELVAATCLVDDHYPSLFLPDKLWRLAPDPSTANPAFLRFLLAHDGFRSELTKTATGTSGSMLNVSMEKLRMLRAPIPPLALQENFDRIVWASLTMKRRQTHAMTHADSLFESLADGAFSEHSTTSQQ